ncbi:unnamed protein product, partial [Nesidiocoris tenuis]
VLRVDRTGDNDIRPHSRAARPPSGGIRKPDKVATQGTGLNKGRRRLGSRQKHFVDITIQKALKKKPFTFEINL